MRLLIINPGSTSTKLAVFDDCLLQWSKTVPHSSEDLASFLTPSSQFSMRLAHVKKALAQQGEDLRSLTAICGRGGIFDPIAGGTYEVDQTLANRLAEGTPWDHASNLGGRLAFQLARELGINAFIVDPVSTDELCSLARITGLPELPKVSLVHALNVKATARRVSADLKVSFKSSNFVVLHLGGGTTVCALKGGEIVDFDSGNDLGPFSPERAGGLPATPLVDYALAEGDGAKVKRYLCGGGGVKAYLGTTDMVAVVERAKNEPKVHVVLESFIKNLACAAGKMAVALNGDLKGIILTGGIAHSSVITEQLSSLLDWIAPVFIYPGEDEMLALALGATRALTGEEVAKKYERS